MKIVLLIPMKGNSERVSNKNMRDFAGKPLYHAVMNEMLKSRYISEIVINTDSDTIKTDVKNNFKNINLIDRPKELIGDFVPMNDIIGYDIEKFDADFYIQTHSTNPLLLVSTLDIAIEKFSDSNKNFDSLFSVTKIQSRLYWENGTAINHNPMELLRTQDLPIIYEENSCFYIFTKSSFKSSGNKRIGLNPFMFAIDKIEAQDIDELQDFIIAEQLYKQLRQKR